MLLCKVLIHQHQLNNLVQFASRSAALQTKPQAQAKLDSQNRDRTM
uniref:Uncharacterized protein n=1 Tax=Arundo donax TaxID=35708 RepID=A0A0A9F7P2_ARUDO